MKSIFASANPDAVPVPVSATPGIWDRFGPKAKLGAGAAAVVGIVAAVVLPGLGNKRPDPQPAQQRQEQASGINDYSAPPARRIMDQATDSNGSTPSPKLSVRRHVPTDIALYASPHVVDGSTPSPRSSMTSEAANGSQNSSDADDRLTPAISGATVLPASKAVMVRHADYTIRPGDPIQCIPQDAQNSGLPGFTRCRVPEWVRGGTQRRGLIPPGTIIFGQIRNGVAQGQQRLGVLFTSIEGPRFKVALAAPGGDAMGRAGLEGDVQTFFWDKAGAVALYSLFDVGIGAGQNLASSALSRAVNGNNGTTLNLGGQAQGLASQEMQSRTNRPPVITRDQALPVLITVGQDLEFYDVCQKLHQSGDSMACPLL